MLDLAYFTALMLVFIRLSSFFIITPVFFPNGTPNALKLFFALIISYMLLPGIDYKESIVLINNNYALILAIINEIMSGIVLGFITGMSFSAIRMAGNLMDMQIGLSMLSMFDPNTKSNSTLLERLMYWMSLLILFILDGHHMIIWSFLDSFKAVSLGKSLITQESSMQIIHSIIQYFWIGLKIALPIIMIIIITELTLGLVARTVPQLNIMILGLPIKIIVGLLTFALALPMLLKGVAGAIDHIPEIMKEMYKFLPMVFIFASEEKTEEATPRKKRDARKKGQIAKSKEVGLAMTLLASTLIIATLSSFSSRLLKEDMVYFLGQNLNLSINEANLRNLMITSLLRFAMSYLPIVLPIMVMGILANYIQSGFLFTTETLKPKLSKLNPINGFKRIFSTRTLVELFKDVILITVVGYVGYKFLRDNYSTILTVGNLYIGSVGPFFKQLVLDIFKKITLIMVILAISDYVYQRYMHKKDLKMTKQEVKEEYKQDEGDPQIKGKIKQKQREMATRRMMQAVPDATVVVTNPTHIAVALKYENGKSEAPIVVAKGSEYVALKIKEVAKENDVPIIENKPLARLIYEEVDIDSEIPDNMYQAVAEILVMVFKLNKKRLK
ncbi:fused FliR family export protein/FlhB family type III secretion system protein [Clostridium sp. MSJ-4]|uniref:Flagellar biosynthetic protein FliR n=1 Tax=Clostridium simiarum TaxID=2841506 RepID=A0ABS6EZB8_9CLOT|nr:fused FliR family export protein/FlhB family type III secretion system protein [Clostridium simiarum]MBU5591065.1 fused FliR family export protein/FlhB family type III secretion system protein [Clostridium simiarum]